jgi:acetyl-CoA synthetase
VATLARVNDAYAHHLSAWRWKIPDALNIAQLCLRHAEPNLPSSNALAIVWESESGIVESVTNAELSRRAARLSNALIGLGLRRGDCIAICLPQRIETAVAHLAIYQMGAIAVPLTVLFGPDAIEYRLKDAACKLAICDEASIENVVSVRANVASLTHIVLCERAESFALTTLRKNVLLWDKLIQLASDEFACVDTQAEDPALIIYTSGTTGPPKGALIPHRALLGNWSGFLYSHNLLPESMTAAGSSFVFWSPADWAWTGGLWDALLPTLFCGGTIIGSQGRFDTERAFALMEKYKVMSTFLFPTALKMMMKTMPNPRGRYDLKLQSIMSAGESVGETVFQWTQEALGVTLNEMFGQTELNYIVGNCAALWPARAGSMGRAYPGHQVAVLDEDGNVLPAGSTGDVAVNRRDIHGDLDPVFFLGYLNNDAGTRAKYTGDWCRTGDMARMDTDGYLWHEGRGDDVIKSAGYRIGPGEVESCLIKHPAVAMAAVIGKPDAERGAIVKAFVVLAQGHVASALLEAEIAQHVRAQLAPYEYPKEIEFVDALPMTTTGKIQRNVLREREAKKQAL